MKGIPNHTMLAIVAPLLSQIVNVHMGTEEDMNAGRLHRIFELLFVALIAVVFVGCDSSRSVRFASDPPGARVTFTDRAYETPCWTLVYWSRITCTVCVH